MCALNPPIFFQASLAIDARDTRDHFDSGGTFFETILNQGRTRKRSTLGDLKNSILFFRIIPTNTIREGDGELRGTTRDSRGWNKFKGQTTLRWGALNLLLPNVGLIESRLFCFCDLGLTQFLN